MRMGSIGITPEITQPHWCAACQGEGDLSLQSTTMAIATIWLVSGSA